MKARISLCIKERLKSMGGLMLREMIFILLMKNHIFMLQQLMEILRLNRFLMLILHLKMMNHGQTCRLLKMEYISTVKSSWIWTLTMKKRRYWVFLRKYIKKSILQTICAFDSKFEKYYETRKLGIPSGDLHLVERSQPQVF